MFIWIGADYFSPCILSVWACKETAESCSTSEGIMWREFHKLFSPSELQPRDYQPAGFIPIYFSKHLWTPWERVSCYSCYSLLTEHRARNASVTGSILHVLIQRMTYMQDTSENVFLLLLLLKTLEILMNINLICDFSFHEHMSDFSGVYEFYLQTVQ